MRSKLKVAEHSNSDQQNMEVVDLAEELPPMPHSIASREYRNLHTSDQKSDGSVRLPKQKPQFAYISGSSPDLPFLRRSKLNDDDVVGSEESEDEDLPSDPLGTSKVGREEPASISTFSEHALSDSEAALLGLEELLPTTSPNPKFNSRFANGIVDLNTFDEEHCNSDAYSSPLMGASRKRERSHSPTLLEGKRHRVSMETEDSRPMRSSNQTEIPATLSTPVAQNRVVQMQDWIDNPQPNSEQTAKQRSVPAWVDEFDAEFIDSFMGIVDFVE
jgi:ATP-dependent DNA helicase HFM1/MER3